MELAIFEDCRALVENFTLTGNPTFFAFCAQWKRMAFQHIYSAQSTTVELQQTTATIFYIAKRFICGKEAQGRVPNGRTVEEWQMMRRIGGMYLMYSIYFKQPTEQYVKVETTLEVWKQLKSFISELPMALQVTDDIRYMFWKLVQAQAFRFTALEYCVGLEQLVDYEKVDEEQGAEPAENAEAGILKKELTPYGGVQAIAPALTVLEEGYNEMKEILSTAKGVDAQALPATTIFSDIQSALRRIEDIMDEQNSRPNKTTTEEHTKDKRYNLKRKGYKLTQSEDVELERNGEERSTQKRSIRSHRRMSARTVFAEQLPKAMLDDLEVIGTSEQDDTSIEQTDSDDPDEILGF